MLKKRWMENLDEKFQVVSSGTTENIKLLNLHLPTYTERSGTVYFTSRE